jgi:hypothetical protein
LIRIKRKIEDNWVSPGFAMCTMLDEKGDT